MKVFVALLALVAFSSALPHNEWLAFKGQHGKSYANQHEETFRMKVFLKNKQRVEEHNARFEQGHVSYTLKMNRFGDMLPEEFALKMNGFNSTKKTQKLGNPLFVPKNQAVPASVDWRTKGAVTPVKDQGQCGSCWAFSTTGSLEGQNFLKNGKLVSLSEQNLVDCSGAYGNMGCSGGLMDSAFQYIKENKGIDTESTYPYEAVDDTCRFKPANVGATDKGAIDIATGDEKALLNAVATVGPISVAIDASQFSFQLYGGGIYDEPSCSSQMLDHGVLAVGYGTDENGKDYWLVKNSWGSSWGESGYIKMSRNKNNQCGISTMASYPSL